MIDSFLEWTMFVVLFSAAIFFAHINDKFKKLVFSVELPRNLKLVFRRITIVYRGVGICLMGIYVLHVFYTKEVYVKMSYMLMVIALFIILESVGEYFKVYLLFKRMKELENGDKNSKRLEE